MKIQTRIVLPYSLTILLFGLVLGGLSGYLAHRAMAARVRANVQRSVELLASSGFPLGAGALEKAAPLVGSGLATLDDDARVLDTTLGPAELEALEAWLAAASPGTLTVDGQRYSVFSAWPPPRPDGVARLLLLYRTSELEGAAREPLVPMLFGVLGGLLLAVLIGQRIGAGLASPIRRLAQRARHIAEETSLPEGDELAALEHSFERMLARLDEVRRSEKLAALGRLVAAVAHEVRNPLTSIRMTLQLAPLDDEGRRRILEEVERLSLYTSELLYFVRPAQPDRVPLDPGPVLEDVVALARPQLAHRGVALKLALEPVGSLLADKNQLKQVFWNLVSNALDCQNEGGEIGLELFRAGDEVVFACADQGPGIPPAQVPHLFEAFDSRKDGGTGLGLWICKAIVEAHGGTIAATSTERGTRLEVRLPAGERRAGST